MPKGGKVPLTLKLSQAVFSEHFGKSLAGGDLARIKVNETSNATELFVVLGFAKHTNPPNLDCSMLDKALQGMWLAILGKVAKLAFLSRTARSPHCFASAMLIGRRQRHERRGFSCLRDNKSCCGRVQANLHAASEAPWQRL